MSADGVGLRIGSHPPKNNRAGCAFQPRSGARIQPTAQAACTKASDRAPKGRKNSSHAPRTKSPLPSPMATPSWSNIGENRSKKPARNESAQGPSRRGLSARGSLQESARNSERETTVESRPSCKHRFGFRVEDKADLLGVFGEMYRISSWSELDKGRPRLTFADE